MSFAILSNHKIHHIYLNLAVLLSNNQNCMMYYMRLCNAEYSQNPSVPTHISRVPSREKFWWFIFRGYTKPQNSDSHSFLKHSVYLDLLLTA